MTRTHPLKSNHECCHNNDSATQTLRTQDLVQEDPAQSTHTSDRNRLDAGLNQTFTRSPLLSSNPHAQRNRVLKRGQKLDRKCNSHSTSLLNVCAI